MHALKRRSHLVTMALFFALASPEAKAAKRQAFAAPKTWTTRLIDDAATSDPNHLRLMSWNLKHLGRDKFMYDEVISQLGNSDLIAFQEVNTSKSGSDALQKLARGMTFLTGKHICVGFSNVPSGEEKERYGYLWLNERIAYVTTKGEVVENCNEDPINVPISTVNTDLIRREPAIGTFLFKPLRQKFIYATVHLRPEGEKPQEEVLPLFEIFSAINLPVIVAGDYNLNDTHSSFKAAADRGFGPALHNTKTSLSTPPNKSHPNKKMGFSKAFDNFWFRNVEVVAVKVSYLYEIFSKLPFATVYNEISDHCPIRGDFSFANTK